MKHGAGEPRALEHSLKMSSRLGCPWPFLGQMVPTSCMCKEVKGNSEFILMNRDKGSLCTQAAAGFHIASAHFWRESRKKEARTAFQAKERTLLNTWESSVTC